MFRFRMWAVTTCRENARKRRSACSVGEKRHRLRMARGWKRALGVFGGEQVGNMRWRVRRLCRCITDVMLYFRSGAQRHPGRLTYPPNPGPSRGAG